MSNRTIHPNDCGNCKHWHEWPEDMQTYSISIGDCDKIEKGTPYDEFTYDGWSFEDECYDEEFHCFEEAI